MHPRQIIGRCNKQKHTEPKVRRILSEYDDNTKHLYNRNQHEKNHVGIANDALNQYSQKSEALVFGRI